MRAGSVTPQPLATSPSPAAGAFASAAWSIDSPAVAFWLLIQLACLALVLLHVPLAASYPPGERLAVEVLLAGQICSAAILSPMLCRTPATTLLAAASTWPLLLLAGGLQARPTASTLLAAAVISGWLAMLWAWQSLSRRPAVRAIIAAITTLVAVAPPLLIYLSAEFGDSGNDTNATGAISAMPLVLAWKVSNGDSMMSVVVLLWIAVILAPIILSRILLRGADDSRISRKACQRMDQNNPPQI
jgi:hypothetical protein